MNSKIDNGGPAFPQNDLSAYGMGPDGIGNGIGMTLRDWFAGQALAGLLAAGMGVRSDGLAAEPYRIADAMIEARKKTAGE